MRNSVLRAALAACLASVPLAAAAQGGCGLFEAVEPGDTFATISDRCAVPVDTLIAANPGVDAAAPDVASTLSLVLPQDSAPKQVVGEPVSPGPRILQAPQVKVVEPVAQVVVIETQNAAPPEPEVSILLPILGQWAPLDQVCADPDTLWNIEDERIVVGGDTCVFENVVLTGDSYVLETICGGNGVVVARNFALRSLDALTMSFVTGEQEGVLTRCAPD